jgi:SAM-dependent methyltransferase
VKWLEYSAMGLATIAANLPPYNSSIAHERTGLLADSNPNSFRIAMRRLVVDSELRGSLQSQAFAVASEKLRLSPTVEPRLERLEQLTKRSRAIRNLPTNGIASAAPTDLCEYLDRRVLSHAFVHGRGIQIGALQKPLPVSPDAQVTYVDRTPKEILYERYQELRGSNLVNVDRIDDGETLSTFGSESQDFIIANHFFDHCQNLTQTIKNFLRVLHPGGLIYMSIPDMRHTFDRERPRTPLGHVVVDHARGAEINREQHFHERLAEPHFGRSYAGESIEARFRELIAQENSVDFRTDHFHALIKRCAEVEALPVSVMFVGELDEEIIFIIRKLDSSGSKTSCSV